MKRWTNRWKSFVQGGVISMVVPLGLLALLEAGIRLSGIDVDATKNKNFKVMVPVWLLADENWVELKKERLKNQGGIPADRLDWFGYFEEARFIQYKMKPLVRAFVVNPFNPIEREKQVKFLMASNSQGFRTKEFSQEKGEHVYRIIALGDSSTFGWGVEATYTFPQRLEETLNAQGGTLRYEVLNLGIPGYTSLHGVNLFNHFAKSLSPDLLIVSFGANDARWLKYPMKEVLALEETWVGALRRFLRNFYTYKLMRKLIFYFYDPVSGKSSGEGRETLQLNQLAVSGKDYQENLAYFIDAAREKGAQAILLGICAPNSYLEMMKNVSLAKEAPFINAHQLFRERLEEITRKEIYKDLVDYYENLYGRKAMEQNRSLYVSTDGCHPNAIGHALIAEAIYHQMKSWHFIAQNRGLILPGLPFNQ